MVSPHRHYFTLSFPKFHLPFSAYTLIILRLFCLQSSQPAIASISLNNTVPSADSDTAISRSLRNMLHRSGSRTHPCGTLLVTSFYCENGLLIPIVLFPVFQPVIYPCNYIFLGSVAFKSFWWVTSPNTFQKSMVRIPGSISLSHKLVDSWTFQ